MNSMNRSIVPWAIGAALIVSPILTSPARSAGEILYTLNTNCTIGNKEEKCKVEAVDYPTATLYRTMLPDDKVTTIRLMDTPIFRAHVWSKEAKDWDPLKTISIQIPENLVCFNTNFCVYNPNFVQAMVEKRSAQHRTPQKIMKARFDDTGEISASCFDQGCDSPL
jgi:hypothetical protein